jgi:hypothetical protein
MRTGDVFVLSTPMQWLHAREAASAFEVTSATVIILLENYRRTDFESLPRPSSFHHIEYVGLHRLPIGRGKLFKAARIPMQFAIDRLGLREISDVASRLGPARRVFLGNGSRNMQRHIAHQLDAQSLVVLDDGASTLDYARKRRDDEPVGATSVATKIRERLLGMNTRTFEDVTFFTAYDIEPTRDRIISNRYDVLRNDIAPVRERRDVWLLGQPLIEYGLTTPESFARILCQTRKFYEGADSVDDVIYIAHPAESSQSRRELLEGMGFGFLPHDGPVELRLAMSNRLPKRLASFFSSAITSSWRIFGDDVPVDILEPSVEVWERTRARIMSTYDHLRDQAVEPHRLIRLDARDGDG